MRLAITVDGLLSNTEGLKREWEDKLGTNFKIDESFYGALRPYEDVPPLSKWIRERDFIVLCERHKQFSLTTRAWLRNHCGLMVPKDRLIMSTIKRYDCRINGVDVLIDADSSTIKNLKLERVAPISGYFVNRKGEAFDGTSYSSLLEVLDELRFTRS
jgi:hypothetical protein